MPFNSACLTEEEFILALEELEVLELSALTKPLEPTINSSKIQFAIDRAGNFIAAGYYSATRCGKATLTLNCQQLTIWLARYFLDTTKSRPFVEADYERAIKIIEQAQDPKAACSISEADITLIIGEAIASNFRSCSGNNSYFYKKPYGLVRENFNNDNTEF